MGSDNYCLRWNEFSATLSSSLTGLRDSCEFFDVTLCPDDGIQKVRAHKVVLAACSPFFKRILEGDSYSNTLLYLKGVDENSLSGILDFIYNGEVNIAQEDLDRFLEVAAELGIKGLADGNKSSLASDYDIKRIPTLKRPPPMLLRPPSRPSCSSSPSSSVEKKKMKMDPSTLMPLLQTGLEENNGLNSNANDEDEDDAIEEDDEEETLEDDFSEYPGGPAAVSGNNNVPGHFLTESSSFNDGPFGQISNLSKDHGNDDTPPSAAALPPSIWDKPLAGMIGDGGGGGPNPNEAENHIRKDPESGLFTCLHCGQTGKKKHHLTRHVEAKHMEVNYACQFCGENFKAKYAMQAHIRRIHRDNHRDPA